METKSFATPIFKITAAVALLLGLILISVASAGPPKQGADPRPTDSAGGAGGGGNGGSDGGSPPETNCSSLSGQVLQWGVGGLGGITTELKTGSWQISAVSATDGNFGYGGLGVGAAKLHVALAPETAQNSRPLIQDAGVYLNCEFPIVANIALFSGETITPPATIEMSASRTSIAPGQQTDISLVITNSLPTGISNVIVTDLLPPALTPINVSTAAGSEAVKIVSASEEGQLVVVNLDKMTSGAKTTIVITVLAESDISLGSQLTSTAALFYRESAAHQASLNLTVGRGAQATTAPTQQATATPTTVADLLATATAEVATTPLAEPTAMPEATAAPTTLITADIASPTPLAEIFEPPPGSLPKTGDTFVPPPAMLPVTGQDPPQEIDNSSMPPVLLPQTGQDSLQIPGHLPNTGLSPIIPVSGLGLAIVAVILHGLRAVYRNKE